MSDLVAVQKIAGWGETEGAGARQRLFANYQTRTSRRNVPLNKDALRGLQLLRMTSKFIGPDDPVFVSRKGTRGAGPGAGANGKDRAGDGQLKFRFSENTTILPAGGGLSYENERAEES
jgi:hypothetical protein